MTKRRLLPMMLCAVLLLGSCSSAADTTAAEDPDTDTPALSSETFEAASAPVDKGTLIAAVARLGEMPHRAESFFLPPGDADPDGPDPGQPILAMEFDGTWSRSVGFLGPNQKQGEPVSYTITDRKLAYFYAPGFPDLDDPAFAANPLFAARDEWIVIDFEALNAAGLSDTPLIVSQSLRDEIDEMVESLADASPSVEGPRSSSRGVETRTFEMTIESGDGIFSRTDVVTIHLDAQGRVREVISVDETFGGGRTEFFDFDADIVIEPPQSATAMTDAVIAFMTPQARAGQPPAPTAAPTPTPAPVLTGPTILSRIDEQPELSIFRALIAEAPGAEAMLGLPNPEPWTVFAPTNDTLERLGAGLEELRANPLLARTFVFHHVANGSYDQQTLADAGPIVSFGGWTIRLTLTDGRGTVRSRGPEAPILIGDIEADDGVLHIITGTLDGSLTPP